MQISGTAAMLCFVQDITGNNSTENHQNSNRIIKKKSSTNHKFYWIKSRSTNSVNIGTRSAPGSPMAPLQGQSEAHDQSVINSNSTAKSPSHLNTTNSTKIDSKSQKQLSPSSVASSSTTSKSSSAVAVGQSQQHDKHQRSISPHPSKSQSTSSVSSTSGGASSGQVSSTTTTAKNEIPEKEKKRKELSSSRQKKFHRHFQQVSKDEKVLNYFSCALVSDILLQGHLYITENYFAFYSNVFGFVTKLLIPTSSVLKVSKEKTAKIIPNAVGVATADERHVFGSFMSREAAFRLMSSVCSSRLEAIALAKPPDIEICEESIDDDSSYSISGNESPPQLLDSTGGSTGCTGGSSDTGQPSSKTATLTPNMRLPTDMDMDGTTGETFYLNTNTTSSTPVKLLKQQQQQQHPILLPSAAIRTDTATITTSLASPIQQPTTLITSNRFNSIIKFKFPTDFHIVYLGIVLTIILTLFSGFLMYRILDIEAKASYRTIDFSKWALNNDGDVYSEALKWQKELQAKSTEEAQQLLNTNLEQIARVRKSLETLSMLIHDKQPTPNYETTGSDCLSDNYEK